MLCESVMFATILSPSKDNQYFLGCGTKDTCNPSDSSDTVIQSSLQDFQSSDLIISNICPSGDNYAARADHQARVYETPRETHQVSGSHSDFDNMDVGKGIDCVEPSTSENQERNAWYMDDSCGISTTHADGTNVLREIDHPQKSSHVDQKENGVINACSVDHRSAERFIKGDISDQFAGPSSDTFDDTSKSALVEGQVANCCSEIKEFGNKDMVIIRDGQVEDRNIGEEKVEALPQPQRVMDIYRADENVSSVYKIDKNFGEKISSLAMRPFADQFSRNPAHTTANPDRSEYILSTVEEKNVAKDPEERMNMPCHQQFENERSEGMVGNNTAQSNIEEKENLSCELHQSSSEIEEIFLSENPVDFHKKSEDVFFKSHNEASISIAESQNPEEPMINTTDKKGADNSAEVSVAEGPCHNKQDLGEEVQDHTAGGLCKEAEDCAEISTTVTTDSVHLENISFKDTSPSKNIEEFNLAHEIEEHRYLTLSPRSSSIAEPSHSLRELLTSEDQLPGQKEERLPSTPPKIGRGNEFFSYRSSVTGSDGMNNSHESLSFPHKWYEDADDDEVLSGPVAFSGALTHSGLICQVPYSGSISHRSDSSTSTRSFAFPILASDFNSSPIKRSSVPDARGHRLWRKFCRSCLCTCRHSSTLSD